MRKRLVSMLAGIALSLGGLSSALAVLPHEVLDDPALEARARELSAELRCLVCQNQSIDDSDALLAADLRVLLRERLEEGDSNEEVIAYLVDRYGEFILLRPRFSTETAVLWGAPFVILLIAMAAAAYGYRNRRRAVVPAVNALSDEEKRQLERIVSRQSPE